MVTFTDCTSAACNRSYGEQGCSRELQSPLLIGPGQLGVFVSQDRIYGARRGDKIDGWVNMDDDGDSGEPFLKDNWRQSSQPRYFLSLHKEGETFSGCLFV